jgi:hypothetical protein
MTRTIDLEELTGHGKVQNLSGRLRGLAAREKFQLDELDSDADDIEVIVPSYVYSLTPSFFQGLFGDSVRAFGNDSAKFMAHFRFTAPAVVLQQVERGLSAILTSRDLSNIR